uniref:Uncharacterized protein n=1 Tax=Steinernema glaseri TaxID=37863 RepID=A0A1I7YRQ3_9BILA
MKGLRREAILLLELSFTKQKILFFLIHFRALHFHPPDSEDPLDPSTSPAQGLQFVVRLKYFTFLPNSSRRSIVSQGTWLVTLHLMRTTVRWQKLHPIISRQPSPEGTFLDHVEPLASLGPLLAKATRTQGRRQRSVILSPLPSPSPLVRNLIPALPSFGLLISKHVLLAPSGHTEALLQEALLEDGPLGLRAPFAAVFFPLLCLVCTLRSLATAAPPMNSLPRVFVLLVAIVVAIVSAAVLPSAEDALQKRSNWQKANGLWGKRAAAGDDITMWKRPEDWTKLNSLWGKRSSWSTANGLWGKRASWQTANGLWGKRSAPAMDYEPVY